MANHIVFLSPNFLLLILWLLLPHKSSIVQKPHLRLWSNGRRDLFSFFIPGFKFYCACLSSPRCLTCSLSLQNIQWAWELVVSLQDIQWAWELVVMLVNWSEHLGLSKKKTVSKSQHNFNLLEAVSRVLQ
jgi:hypothetical protein